MLLLSIFLHKNVENNQEVTKERSFGTSHGVSTYLLTFSLRMTPFGVFPDYFSFDHFLANIAFRKKDQVHLILH